MKNFRQNSSKSSPVSNGVNTFFEQFKNEAKRIALTKDERDTMRAALLNAMEGGLKSPIQPVKSPYFSFVMPRALAPMLSLILIVSGGVAYAAEGALPGEILYPVKIHVNEKVASAFAVSEESKAALHASIAEKRLEEAETLAGRGALSEAVKVELEDGFNEHASEVESLVAAVEKKDPIVAADISARFKSALAAHGNVIASIGEGSRDEGSRRESGKLAIAVKDRGRKNANAEISIAIAAERKAPEAAEGRTLAQSADIVSITVSNTDSAVIERLLKHASTTLDEAQSNFFSIKDSLDLETASRIEAYITAIRSEIETAAMADKDRMERALKNAIAVKAFLEAQGKVHTRALLPPGEVHKIFEDDEREEKGGPSIRPMQL